MADFEVRLTRSAVIDLESLLEFVKDNRSTQQTDTRPGHLLTAIETLGTCPAHGSGPKELDADGIREFRQFLVEPYRPIYRVSRKTVFVVVIADDRRVLLALLERRLFGSRGEQLRGCAVESARRAV